MRASRKRAAASPTAGSAKKRPARRQRKLANHGDIVADAVTTDNDDNARNADNADNVDSTQGKDNEDFGRDESIGDEEEEEDRRLTDLIKREIRGIYEPFSEYGFLQSAIADVDEDKLRGFIQSSDHALIEDVVMELEVQIMLLEVDGLECRDRCRQYPAEDSRDNPFCQKWLFHLEYGQQILEEILAIVSIYILSTPHESWDPNMIDIFSCCISSNSKRMATPSPGCLISQGEGEV
jgi:hypothetical protein